MTNQSVCEMELYGGSFGELGIPIGFVSGEDIAVQQTVRSMPWLKTVSVDKKKESYSSGKSSIDYVTAHRQLLQEKTAEAVLQVNNMKPLVYTKPLYFEAIFKSETVAKQYNTWGLERNNNIIH